MWAPAFAKKKTKNYDDAEAYRFLKKDTLTTEPPGAWNNFGHDEQKGVDELFVGVEEVMGIDDRPTSSQTVVNMIGDQVIGSIKRKREDRLQHLDETGEYKDGKDRGMIPKRMLEERAKRLQLRRSEMEHASAVLREWNGLTPAEQEQRRGAARFNMSEMLKSLEVEIEQEVPGDYRLETRDILPAIVIEEPLFVDEKPAVRTLTSSRRSSSANIPTSPQHSWKSSLPFRAPTSRTNSRTQSRQRQQPRKAPVPFAIPTSTRSLATETSLFSVKGFPDIVELEKALSSLSLEDSIEERAQRARLECGRSGRLVVIQLSKQIKFSSEGVVSRLFAGVVQEIQ